MSFEKSANLITFQFSNLLSVLTLGKKLIRSQSAKDDREDMKLTTRSHYSVKALLDLAFQPNYGPVSVKTIAKRQQLPAPYLEKLLIELRRSGLVHSLRGVQGGYQLSFPPESISLGQILDAVGETFDPLPHHNPSQAQATDSVTLAIWNRLHQKLKEALYNISLADLYYDARSWQAAQGEDYNFIV